MYILTEQWENGWHEVGTFKTRRAAETAQALRAKTRRTILRVHKQGELTWIADRGPGYHHKRKNEE